MSPYLLVIPPILASVLLWQRKGESATIAAVATSLNEQQGSAIVLQLGVLSLLALLVPNVLTRVIHMLYLAVLVTCVTAELFKDYVQPKTVEDFA